MGTSLTELILAMTLGALLFAGAVIPATQAFVTYQKADAELRAQSAQTLAATRVEQIAASLWRGSEPPAGTGALRSARTNQLRIDGWRVRRTKDRVEQRKDGLQWAALAQPVSRFSLEYLLADGSWAAKVAKGRFDDILAIRFQWADAGGRVRGGWAVPADRLLARFALPLPQPDLTRPVYRRADYARTLELPLGSWK